MLCLLNLYIYVYRKRNHLLNPQKAHMSNTLFHCCNFSGRAALQSTVHLTTIKWQNTKLKSFASGCMVPRPAHLSGSEKKTLWIPIRIQIKRLDTQNSVVGPDP
jgi:hypothetical protein